MRYKIIRLISLILSAVTVLFAFASCNDTEDNTADGATAASSVGEATENTPDPVFDIIKDGEPCFTLVRAEMAHSAVISATVTLNKKISQKTGTMLTVKDDFARNVPEETIRSSYEILVGETNRAESAEVLSSLPKNSYAIKKLGNKIVIIGKDQNLTMLALYKFEELILNNSEKCSHGTLSFSDEDSTTVTLEKEFTLPEIIRSGYEYVAETEYLFSCKAYSADIRVAQGAASDGKYAYFVIRHTGDLGAVIYKYELATGKYVAESEIVQVGHGNDATFDTSTNTLVIAHGQSQGRTLTLMDPNTLTVIRTVSIGQGAGAISYNAKRDMFAISQGGSSLHLLSYDFFVKKSYTRSNKSGYTAQGMGCDDDFVYFPMSGTEDNLLEVYDWEGKFITGIKIADKFESESFFWVNGKYYISYYKGAADPGAHLYELRLNVVYK